MTDTTTTGELDVLATLRQLTDTYAAQVEAEQEAERRRAEQARREREERQRAAAEDAAHMGVTCDFPNTLALVVAPEMWRGYPSGGPDERRHEPASAVAYLGQGMWLRHFEGAYGQHVFSLIRPCPCGRTHEVIILHEELQLHRLLDDTVHRTCFHAH